MRKQTPDVEAQLQAYCNNLNLNIEVRECKITLENRCYWQVKVFIETFRVAWADGRDRLLARVRAVAQAWAKLSKYTPAQVLNALQAMKARREQRQFVKRLITQTNEVIAAPKQTHTRSMKAKKTRAQKTKKKKKSARRKKSVNVENIYRIIDEIASKDGLANERRVLDAFRAVDPASDQLPPWFRGIEKTNDTLDIDGIDYIVHSDIGRLCIQIKRSMTGLLKFRRKYWKRRINVAIINTHDYQEIRRRVLAEAEKLRNEILREREKASTT